MMYKNILFILFYVFIIFNVIGGSISNTKPDVIDTIEEDPTVIGNIDPTNFEKLDELKDGSLTDDQKIQKASQILKSDSGTKDYADTIIRKVSSGGDSGSSSSSSSISGKSGTSGSSSDFKVKSSNSINSDSQLSAIRNEFESNYETYYSSLDSEGKKIADELQTEFEDTSLSLSELTAKVNNIISEASTTVKNEVQFLVPIDIALDMSGHASIKTTTQVSKFGAIKNGIKSLFGKHSTTEMY
uniref:DUF148 domain-containing protein n=1 Tax=Parastrongyloides trichosuri TaxID=131310 RepID=A0A0N4ZQB6_PARTI